MNFGFVFWRLRNLLNLQRRKKNILCRWQLTTISIFFRIQLTSTKQWTKIAIHPSVWVDKLNGIFCVIQKLVVYSCFGYFMEIDVKWSLAEIDQFGSTRIGTKPWRIVFTFTCTFFTNFSFFFFDVPINEYDV